MISTEKKIIILSPPKTASTSLGDVFRRAQINFNVSTKIVGYPVFHPKLSEICELHDIVNPEEYTILQFTRNPYYRFVSSYYQLIRISPNNEKITFPNLANLTILKKDNTGFDFGGHNFALEYITKNSKSYVL